MCTALLPSEGGPMKDMLAHLEKLRADAAECALIRDLATDQAKKDYSLASLSTRSTRRGSRASHQRGEREQLMPIKKRPRQDAARQGRPHR
jgi:hypothetical protein